jgi:dTDP-4-amino-4,6-dideoxygalactose transaminase
VWESKWLSNGGKKHELLESKLRDVLKTPYLSLFNNGTIALMVAIESLRINGDVITTPFTFPATPHALAWNGIKPIFCDIEPDTFNIDSDKIESMITPQTSAILAVHVFGNPCNVNKIQEIANHYGLKVVYDAAHAFGTEINGVGIGSFGDISMFSFHPTKLFHTAEGGALTFNDKNLKERIEVLKNFGIKNQDEVIMPGINGKMNELSAVMGLLVLEMFENEQNKRRDILAAYHENLKDIEGVKFIDDNQSVKNSYQYFCIQIDEKKFGKSRDYVHDAFKKYNVMTRKYFFPLCSDYSCYRQLPSSNKNNLPVASKVVEEILCMPFYGGLTSEDVARICLMLKEIQNDK